MDVQSKVIEAVATETLSTMKEFFPKRSGRTPNGKWSFQDAVEQLVEALQMEAKPRRANGRVKAKKTQRRKTRRTKVKAKGKGKTWSKAARAAASERMAKTWRKRKRDAKAKA